MVEDGKLENQPDNIEPKVMCEETEWKDNYGGKEEFDLIINNMSLHWNNDVETCLSNFHDSLKSDGAFISCSLGGDTLQELRICMNLAE